MHHGRDRVIVKHASHGNEIAEVSVDPGNGASRERFETRQNGRGAVREVVEHDGRVPTSCELDDDMRADVAGATGNKDGFRHRPGIVHRRGAIAASNAAPLEFTVPACNKKAGEPGLFCRHDGPR